MLRLHLNRTFLSELCARKWKFLHFLVDIIIKVDGITTIQKLYNPYTGIYLFNFSGVLFCVSNVNLKTLST